MLAWTRLGGKSDGEDPVTGLRLLVEPIGDEFDFNGHKFKTEVEARAFAEVYAVDAIRRHGLSATNKAR